MPDRITVDTESFVTLATNDSYAIGALVLSSSLKRVNTTRQLTVLVTSGVSWSVREQLTGAFHSVVDVDVLDSNDAVNLKLLGRPDLGQTFTKLHCWRLVNYTKCVFLDADTLVLQNIDELFDREEFSATPDVGWPDCFNSGVFVYRPSLKTYSELLQLGVISGSFDGGDQGLLNMYFDDWAVKDISTHLPFLYNVVASAFYSYLPAYKKFGCDIKVAHFIGPLKPWHLCFNKTTGRVVHGRGGSGSENVSDLVDVWWRIYLEDVHRKLDDTLVLPANSELLLVPTPVQATPEQMTTPAESTASIYLAPNFSMSSAGCPTEDHHRQYGWERGEIDYLGVDSFENILTKLKDSLEKPGTSSTTTDGSATQIQMSDRSRAFNEELLVKKSTSRRVGNGNQKVVRSGDVVGVKKTVLPAGGSIRAQDRVERSLSKQIQRRKVFVNSSTGEVEDRVAITRERMIKEELMNAATVSSFRGSVGGEAEFGSHSTIGVADGGKVKVEDDLQPQPEADIQQLVGTSGDGVAEDPALKDGKSGEDLATSSDNAANEEAGKGDSYPADVEKGSAGDNDTVLEHRSVEGDAVRDDAEVKSSSAIVELDSLVSRSDATRQVLLGPQPHEAAFDERGVEVEKKSPSPAAAGSGAVKFKQCGAVEGVRVFDPEDVLEPIVSAEDVVVEPLLAGVDKKTPAGDAAGDAKKAPAGGDKVALAQRSAVGGDLIGASAVVEVEASDKAEGGAGVGRPGVESGKATIAERSSQVAPQKKKNRKKKNK